MTSIQQALRDAFEVLKKTSPTPRIDAELLLLHVNHQSRQYLYAHPESELNELQLAEYKEFIRKRLAGIPVAYLRGHQAFWDLELAVTTDTLIPRPETERLVEIALEMLAQGTKLDILELGTGCGAIALALASEQPEWRIWATDQSDKALEVARNNANRLNLEITFLQGKWLEAVPGLQFDAIVSNPPYIAADDSHLQQGDLRYEPQAALVADEDGLKDLRLIIQQSPQFLKPNGWLILEHGYNQQDDVITLLQQSGYKNIKSHQDYANKDRAITAQINVIQAHSRL